VPEDEPQVYEHLGGEVLRSGEAGVVTGGDARQSLAISSQQFTAGHRPTSSSGRPVLTGKSLVGDLNKGQALRCQRVLEVTVSHLLAVCDG
jgi:hypothetical protein